MVVHGEELFLYGGHSVAQQPDGTELETVFDDMWRLDLKSFEARRCVPEVSGLGLGNLLWQSHAWHLAVRAFRALFDSDLALYIIGDIRNAGPRTRTLPSLIASCPKVRVRTRLRPDFRGLFNPGAVLSGVCHKHCALVVTAS